MIIRYILKKDEYKPIEQVDKDKYRLMWGKIEFVNKVYQTDEVGNLVIGESGEPVVIEELESDYCSCCTETVRLPKNTYNLVSMVEEGRKSGHTTPSMEEWAAWAEVFSPEKERLDFLKERLGEKIDAYGSGVYDVYGEKAVDDFTIGGIHLWFDSTMRTKIRENLESCEREGLTETVLRFNGMEFPTTVENGWNMYYAVLSYARICWNRKEQHHINKRLLPSIDQVVAYDFTTGYPEKLVF